jgi:hypothetical protein
MMFAAPTRAIALCFIALMAICTGAMQIQSFVPMKVAMRQALTFAVLRPAHVLHWTAKIGFCARVQIKFIVTAGNARKKLTKTRVVYLRLSAAHFSI